jgi:hypothetical protein
MIFGFRAAAGAMFAVIYVLRSASAALYEVESGDLARDSLNRGHPDVCEGQLPASAKGFLTATPAVDAVSNTYCATAVWHVARIRPGIVLH